MNPESTASPRLLLSQTFHSSSWNEAAHPDPFGSHQNDRTHALTSPMRYGVAGRRRTTTRARKINRARTATCPLPSKPSAHLESATHSTGRTHPRDLSRAHHGCRVLGGWFGTTECGWIQSKFKCPLLSVDVLSRSPSVSGPTFERFKGSHQSPSATAQVFAVLSPPIKLVQWASSVVLVPFPPIPPHPPLAIALTAPPCVRHPRSRGVCVCVWFGCAPNGSPGILPLVRLRDCAEWLLAGSREDGRGGAGRAYR